MGPLVAAALLLGASALATEESADGPPASATEPEAPPADDGSFAEVLERAKATYFSGGHVEALDLLEGLRDRLEAGEEVDPKAAGEALIYLGEILQIDGYAVESYETFKYALTLHPDQTISIYHHPPEVVNLFGLARRELLDPPDVPPPPPPPPPPPWWTFAPLGIPQFGQQRSGTGVLLGGLQLGLGATSIVMYVKLKQDSTLDYRPEVGKADLGAFNRRRALQVAITTAAWGSYAISVRDARRSHRAALSVEPSTDGMAMRWTTTW